MNVGNYIMGPEDRTPTQTLWLVPDDRQAPGESV